MATVDEFIQSTRSFLKDFCDQLGWQYPSKSVAIQRDQCKVPDSVIDGPRNEERSEENDQLFPPSFDESDRCSIQLSKSLVSEVLLKSGNLADGRNYDFVIPKSSSDLQVYFNPSQRLALYDHIVEQTKDQVQTLPLNEFDLAFFDGYSECSDQTRSEKSKYDLLSEERDHKRRRVNYKHIKKVHTKNKSHTEVMAEVISNQMEMYQEWLKACNVTKEDSNPQINIKEEKSQQAEHNSRKRHRERSRSPHHKRGKKHHREKSEREHKDKEKRHGKHKKHKKDKK
ncbi:U11/U12 small nuclear ribonucleoprotein 48 kDa protein-like [Cloeon dipterum]|uniref:U11/U12 small nuclear ribonucleoprotein 48 kDa protein-like n=1 Tax=Cloeon dipterum TaxID=197152 RepID=UPI0032206322